MSAVADTARVSIILADFAAADAIKKLNIIGAGWQVAPIDPATGATPPQAVIVVIEVPPAHYNEDLAWSLALTDEAGAVVHVSQPPLGEPQALRVAHVVRADEPVFLSAPHIPRGKVWARTQMILNFPGGLILLPGQMYSWQLQIDGEEDPRWATSFFVPGPPPHPVMG